MNVTLSEVFEHEKSQLSIFEANDLDRFIERTKNGHAQGLARHVQIVLGFDADERLIGGIVNGEAGALIAWHQDDVVFLRALRRPASHESAPAWITIL